MSSHHVVREAQEPALLILRPELLTEPSIAPMLEWSPTIIVTGDALNLQAEFPIKLDVVVATLKQLEDLQPVLEKQAPVRSIPVQEPDNVLDMALQFLNQEGHSAVNILCDPAQLSKELLSNLCSQLHIQNVVVLSGTERLALFRSGEYNKWLPQAEEIRLIPYQANAFVTSHGFVHDLHEEGISAARLLHKQEAGRATIKADSPFWIAEKIS